MKRLYIVRHCKADGQLPEARLTAEGEEQAEALADFLQDKGVERIVASPFLRAIQSVEPLGDRLALPIRADERLAERVLSTEVLSGWVDRLRESFDDLDAVLAGGESSRTAMARGVEAIREIIDFPVDTTVVVSHGNLIALMLKHFDDRTGFAEWQALTNPDVYLVTMAEGAARVERIWR
jgi:2,3-bisphosphoglycerate-dependent phosphoglycerate mutase